MRYLSHLNSALRIIKQYEGKEPFSHFIKNNFKQEKKFGSTDRKTISNLCYSYFRLGNALKNIPAEEKLVIGLFLCNDHKTELLAYFKPEWNEKIHLPLAEKLSVIDHPFSSMDIFPWKDELSIAVEYENFCNSFFTQPDLFLRIRPGKEIVVKEKLQHAQIEFREITSSCVALNNSTKVENILAINKEAVIQDYSSQQTADLIQTQNYKLQTVKAWDCCAASGGKSIMLYDLFANIDLTVSDIRKSMLINLEKRFAEAGVKKYHSFIADLSDNKNKKPSEKFDLILLDAPCSGSGTWGRTPEAISFFDEKEIIKYSGLQKKILDNVVPCLKENGQFVYITCSIFKKENEEIVDYIQQKFQLQLQRIELLKGYESNADSMFVAAFTG